MKFVSSREIRVNPRPMFDAAAEGDEVVITSRGKPVALLVGVSRDDLEETVRLFRRARAPGRGSTPSYARSLNRNAGANCVLNLHNRPEATAQSRAGIMPRRESSAS